MHRFIFPDNTNARITAFFTGKDPGVDLETISSIIKIDKQSIYLPIQKHTDTVILINSADKPEVGDAVITDSSGILIGVQVADCVPILIHDRNRDVISVVHAGWRSTAERLLKKTVAVIRDRFMCSSENIMIAMGPSIRWCCYGVGHEVLEKVKKATGEGEYFMKRDDSLCLDLPSANKYQAMSMGIPQANIWISEECTFCLPDKFYSYRYSKFPTGRQGGFIGKIG
jgi:YfiH family protein